MCANIAKTMKYPILFLGIAAMLAACKPKYTQVKISDATIHASIEAITTAYPDVDATLVTRGVEQVASLWNETDGSFGSVGAFSLRPGHTKEHKSNIKRFIYDTIKDLIKLSEEDCL